MKAKVNLLVLLFLSFCMLKAYSQTDKKFENALKMNVVESIVSSISDNSNSINTTQQTTQSGSPTIYFTDGTKKSFRSIVSIGQEAGKNESQVSQKKEGLSIFYQNSYRSLPWQNISKILVIPERIKWSFVYGELEVTTKNGITFITPVTINSMIVTIFDELTDGITTQNYFFADQDKLLISRIEF